jgi:hypothetical protein
MGAVYEAWQPDLARHVAIKVLPAGPLIAPEARGGWLHEARAASRVRHRNIVQIFQVGEREGWAYLVLERVPGGSLKDRLRGPLPARAAAELIAAVAPAVEHLHRAGLLHLDLKPSNILLDGPPEGPLDQATPMLADFGIARLHDDPAATLTDAGAFGTPAYMAPERIRGDRAAIGPPADLFALGATLYHLLTGRPPFLGASVVETLDQVRGREPVAPRSLAPGLSRDLETICLKCLEKDPARRYTSARALGEDLRRWLDGRPIAARPVSPPARLRRWCLRRPATAALAGALVLTLVASFAGLLGLLARSEAARRTALGQEAFAARALNELNRVLALTVSEAWPPSHEQMAATVRAVRAEANRLRGQPRGVGAASLANLAALEHLVAYNLVAHGDLGGARALCDDAITLLEEGVRLHPGDGNLRMQRFSAVVLSAELDSRARRLEPALATTVRAEPLIGTLAPGSERASAALGIYRLRRRIAHEFATHGDPQAARRTLEANLGLLRVLDQATASTGVDRAILQALVASDLDDPHTVAPVRITPRGRLTWIEDPMGCSESVGQHDRALAWIVLAVDPFTGPTSQADRAADGEDLDAWANALVASIRRATEALGFDPSATMTVGFHLAEYACYAAGSQRHAGRLGTARATTARLAALGRALARDDPRNAAGAAFIASKAHQQVAKNAWQRDDLAAVERALTDSLASARQAARTDPSHPGLATHIARLEDRLAFLHDQPQNAP